MAVHPYSDRMIYELVRVRDQGWVLPKFRQALLDRVRGHLAIDEQPDPVLNRTVRVATLLDTKTLLPLDIPALIDPTILKAAKSFMVLAGIERIHDPLQNKDFEYAQSWVLWESESNWDIGLHAR